MKSATLLLSVAAASVALWSASASAYPWMISHGYTSCASCHVDPLGGGQLTSYGRGMDDLLVRWKLDAPKEGEDEGDPSPSAGFMFGLLNPPDWLNLSGNIRGGGMAIDTVSGAKNNLAAFPLVMALDGEATVNLSAFVAHASLGYAPRRAGPAALWAPNGAKGVDDNAIVSREHWVGLKLFDDSLVFRAGRIPIPFGLRNNEHTSFVRDLTRTDTNVDQEHGLTVAYANDFLRSEVMFIAGNYQVRPDAVRERGAAGLVEFFPAEHLGVGLSSLTTYAARDIDLGVPMLRNADGLFLRWSPVEPLAVLAEADALVTSHDGFTHVGGVGWLQVDWAIVEGVHLMPSLEAVDTGDPASRPPAAGVWTGVAWYVLPHTELRFDVMARESFPSTGPPQPEFAGVAQLHLFL